MSGHPNCLCVTRSISRNEELKKEKPLCQTYWNCRHPHEWMARRICSMHVMHVLGQCSQRLERSNLHGKALRLRHNMPSIESGVVKAELGL